MKDEFVTYYKEVGERIREVRQQKGMSQEELAAKAQLSTPHISEIERGRKEPKLASMCRISEALATPTDYFLRPKIPETLQYEIRDLDDLLKDCSPAQIDLITRLIREVRKTNI